MLLFGRNRRCRNRYIGRNGQTFVMGNAHWKSLWKVKKERQTDLWTSLRWVFHYLPSYCFLLLHRFLYCTGSFFNKHIPYFLYLILEKKIDLKSVDLKKLKVRDLKKILNDWDEGCDGCLEKGDFIKRIEELKPKHMREGLWKTNFTSLLDHHS